MLGVGPAGEYAGGLGEDARVALRERCRELLPDAPRAVAWAARGVVARPPEPRPGAGRVPRGERWPAAPGR